MGQKSNPIGLRLGINRGWDSVWYDEKNFSDRIKEDLVIRNYIYNQYPTASISKLEIKRTSERATVTVHTARPGLIIGKGGSEVDILKKNLNKLIGYEVQVNVSEIKRPALVASSKENSLKVSSTVSLTFLFTMQKAVSPSSHSFIP